MRRIQSDRAFRLWDYRVSHDQLLLRSPKSETQPRNHDVIFAGVEYLELPTQLSGLALRPANSTEVAEARRRRGKPVPADRVFAITADGDCYLIIAATVREEENELDLFESSLESFGS
jgi:hypothetical protein